MQFVLLLMFIVTSLHNEPVFNSCCHENSNIFIFNKGINPSSYCSSFKDSIDILIFLYHQSGVLSAEFGNRSRYTYYRNENDTKCPNKDFGKSTSKAETPITSEAWQDLEPILLEKIRKLGLLLGFMTGFRFQYTADWHPHIFSFFLWRDSYYAIQQIYCERGWQDQSQFSRVHSVRPKYL